MKTTTFNVFLAAVFAAIAVCSAAVGQTITVDNVNDVRDAGYDATIEDHITGYGTWNSDGIPSGTTVQIFDSIGTLVENNWIGTTPDGLASGNVKSTVGVGFEGENHDTIIRNNRIAGIIGQCGNPQHCGNSLFGRAMYFNGEGDGFTIVGNTIGLNANDEPLLGSVIGIDVGYFNYSAITDVQIGGTQPGEGNIIAGHFFNGITVQRDVPSVRISGNSIYANGALGIDLVPTGFGYGVTPNDPLDADTGGNGLQNFPEITTATTTGSTLNVVGMLQSSPTSQFTIEFFASADCDASGHGEGQIYLGSTTVTTDEAGNANFEVSLSASVAEGWVLTSTATLEPTGVTSEFSAWVDVTIDVSDPITIPVDSFNIIRGIKIEGDLQDILDSDDAYLKFNPGIILAPTEPPVWIEFIGTFPSDEPASLSFRIESRANTVGLAQTIEFFNFQSGSYEEVDSSQTTMVDNVFEIEATGNIDRFVEPGSGIVKARLAWQAQVPVSIPLDDQH